MPQRIPSTTLVSIWAAFSLLLITGAFGALHIASAQSNTSPSEHGAEGNKVALVLDASGPIPVKAAPGDNTEGGAEGGAGGSGQNGSDSSDSPDVANTASESTWDKVKWLVIGVGVGAIVMAAVGVALALRRK